MEYIPGGTLVRFRRSYGAERVPVETGVDLIKQVCRGLSLAHRAAPPIIHRDIKPQNILVGYEADGLRARLSDFGLAKEVNPLTLLATAAGTITFKPPEAFKGRRHTDSPSTDIFALGVTLYLLLTDELPYHVDRDQDWGKNPQACRPPKPPSHWNHLVDEVLDIIVLRCLDLNPKHRYQNATELLTSLDAWKPKTVQPAEASHSRKSTKTSLTLAPPLDEAAGRKLSAEARRLAKSGALNDAADMMEEAFNFSPTLRAKYASQVRLWRLGISM